MPSLRLTEVEANDIAAYLLTLERPDYTPDDFALGEAGSLMLAELVAELKKGQATIEIAREEGTRAREEAAERVHRVAGDGAGEVGALIYFALPPGHLNADAFDVRIDGA